MLLLIGLMFMVSGHVGLGVLFVFWYWMTQDDE